MKRSGRDLLAWKLPSTKERVISRDSKETARSDAEEEKTQQKESQSRGIVSFWWGRGVLLLYSIYPLAGGGHQAMRLLENAAALRAAPLFSLGRVAGRKRGALPATMAGCLAASHPTRYDSWAGCFAGPRFGA